MNQGIQLDIEQVVAIAVDSGIVNALCTIRQPDGTFSDSGAPSGNYTAVPGMVGIQCMDAPESISKPAAGETKTVEEQLSTQPRHVWLAGYFPSIAEHSDWQAEITEISGEVNTYDILGAECDSQCQMTRIAGRIASV